MENRPKISSLLNFHKAKLNDFLEDLPEQVLKIFLNQSVMDYIKYLKNKNVLFDFVDKSFQ
jgi:hypothetical protein